MQYSPSLVEIRFESIQRQVLEDLKFQSISTELGKIYKTVPASDRYADTDLIPGVYEGSVP